MIGAQPSAGIPGFPSVKFSCPVVLSDFGIFYKCGVSREFAYGIAGKSVEESKPENIFGDKMPAR